MFHSNLNQFASSTNVSGLLLSEVKSGVFRIKNSKNGSEYYWKLIASNAETLCHSDNYSSKQSAHNGIVRCIKYISIAPIVDESTTNFESIPTGNCGAFRVKYDSNHSCYYWVLNDSNGENLCNSELYFSRQSALNSIATCRRNVSNARIIDGAFSSYSS